MAGGVTTLCLFCLRNGATVKRDKHGRPYLSCWRCHARCFLYEDIQLRSYFAAVKAVYEKIGVVREQYEREAEMIMNGQGLDVTNPESEIRPAPVEKEQSHVKSR